ncbi:MAG: metallophosphoesterase [Pirellula sp.]
MNRTWMQMVVVACVGALAPSSGFSQPPDERNPNRREQQDPKKPRRGEQGNNGQRGGSKLGNYTEPPAANRVPDHLYNILLGRPTDHSITVRVLFHRPATATLEFGTQSGQYEHRTEPRRFEAKGVQDFVLDALAADQRYYYRLILQEASGEETWSDEATFHTQRAPGSPFVFTVQSDSHLDENTRGEVYLRTLANALSDGPDFHLELGDTFMTGKYARPELSEPQYYAQRYYLGSLCHSAAFYFALGNHDGESGNRGSTRWATQTRLRLFPNPFPDGFYTGNETNEDGIGMPQNYYQWKWGDAQFLVLDPFRYTTERSRDGEAWNWTLGETQYRWLVHALQSVDAKYRFVFLHHLVGGSPTNSRGGVEFAPYWEWGGRGASGENEFAQRRPGWEAPIHELLVKHGASIVFHGHDHMFIQQELDGIVYQLVPQPGFQRVGNTNSAAEYGYVLGTAQGSPGHIRVRVGADSARIDYVRSFLPGDESPRQVNGEVSYSYEVRSKSDAVPTSNR